MKAQRQTVAVILLGGATLLGAGLAANAADTTAQAPRSAEARPQSQAKPPAKAESKPKPPASRPKQKSTPAEPQPARVDQPPAANPQETANCTVDTVAETGPVTYMVPIPIPGSKQRLASCLIPPKQAMALYKKGGLFIVDVRQASEFERYRIPGAMNIPLSFVKAKAFLKAQPFVLVDATPGSGELESACLQLREAGFKQAAVLRGGLLGWRRSGGVIEGDLLSQRGLNRMAPVEFAEEGGYADWVVVSVANAPEQEVTKLFPKAVALPHPNDDATFAAELKAAVAKRTRKGTELNVLIVDTDGSRIEKLESMTPGSLASPVLFLEGGLAGYRKFWTEQAAIWAAADRGPKRPRCGA